LFEQSRPRSRDVHLIVADGASQLFLPQGSRLSRAGPRMFDLSAAPRVRVT
jgi:hypothetical protein